MLRIALLAFAVTLSSAATGCIDQEEEDTKERRSTSDDPDRQDEDQDQDETPPPGCRASLRNTENCDLPPP